MDFIILKIKIKILEFMSLWFINLMRLFNRFNGLINNLSNFSLIFLKLFSVVGLGLQPTDHEVDPLMPIPKPLMYQI